MQIATRELGGDGLLVAFDGETALDASTTEALRAALSDLGEQHQRIVIDFGNVSFLDSSALGVFVALLRRLTQQGGSLRIAALRPSVKMIFAVTRLDRVFSSAETVDEAVGAVAAS